MPYIITTTRENAPEPDTFAEHDANTIRRAVATLEEAREEVADLILAHDSIGEFGADAQATGAVGESGGTVGPLPDGTVIEVQRVAWQWLIGVLEDRGVDLSDVEADVEMIDLYNAPAAA